MRVGRLALELLSSSGEVVGQAAVEVRSRKISYRSDMREMLADITEYAVELAFDAASPTTLKARPDPARHPSVIYQQFCFLKGLFDSGELDKALRLIVTRPNERLSHAINKQQLNRRTRLGRKAITELANSGHRQALPLTHPLSRIVPSVPTFVSASQAFRTIDTPENRFVKFFLEEIGGFIRRVVDAVDASNSRGLDRLRLEALEMLRWIEGYGSHPILKAVSAAQRLPLDSPILQRQAGYREVMLSWVRFDLAARLIWEGAEDVYSAGQQDVATLYEYWVFFKLLRIFSEQFNVDQALGSKLFEETNNRLNLRLKAGRNIAINGQASVNGVPLKAKFDYNRTFERRDDVEKIGTWSQRMRPDYTVTIWPADVLEDEAAKNGNLVHIHFDAKYRVDSLDSLFGRDDATMESDVDQEAGAGASVKRDDLLKMHAYRDAIRRSVGAYVIYPGTESVQWSGYHELLPGLGAFVLRPGTGTTGLSEFLARVAQHMAMDSTQRDVSRYVAEAYAGKSAAVKRVRIASSSGAAE
jgi:predicted component of viral defense system (DUF524 family)